ncbi:ABC transporter ATP-binding protein [Streptacidiphilus fuscans]|uniref:Nitrate/sulfonate/bicarbonate ABC transporter ATP-binding protein n=1 Tax=Streptacidiphilus fuscans TaxID=2789292 RepID=A0A931AXM4_9ACTN|nr:nitrate/sulfonate/bicarbonate ABC transporter ATP-binding protein [Streptacidiphilus fuscans]MBF9066744.1 nitrate/sulfonate/bicarbonate ABC transporter ATP-binding protein [Streptacidiphilus fuscans]
MSSTSAHDRTAGSVPPVIIRAEGLSKAFTAPDGSPLPVLDNIDLALREGEIVALLGRSGSGKSTLLRCLAGLIAPSTGGVSYRGQQINGANPGVAMVFQSFALLPWLTVQQNVELSLQAREVPEAERTERALKAIDLIGLDGFEGAYPKELSGGMRQRVGFARGIVVEPDALFMDEPFSALDVLTAENLRSELVGLWEGNEAPVKSILIVTHNIEEAVLLADRVLVLSSNPGRIKAEIPIDLPRPRDRQDPRFESIVDTVYGLLTGRSGHGAEAAPHADHEEARDRTPATPVNTPLPVVTVGGLAGLLQILVARGGEDGLAELADELNFEVDDLLPLVDAAVMLGLARTRDARISVTPEGREITEADILTSKQLFAGHVAKHAPLVRAIVQALSRTEDHTLREGLFLDLLRRGFSTEEARIQLDTAIDWGRYAELYDYDHNDAEFTLEPGAQAHL